MLEIPTNFVDIIGYAAAISTTVAFIPQTIKVIKTRDTKSLSLAMYLIFTIGVILWCIYGIIKLDFPLIIANSITATLSLIILFIKLTNKD
jgi:MtN3 and saliva related transmembrane protein